MLISQLPPDLRALAELRRKEQPKFWKVNKDDLFDAFAWGNTPEDYDFWAYVDDHGNAPHDWVAPLHEPPAPFPEALIREAVRMARHLMLPLPKDPHYTEDEIVNELKKKV